MKARIFLNVHTSLSLKSLTSLFRGKRFSCHQAPATNPAGPLFSPSAALFFRRFSLTAAGKKNFQHLTCCGQQNDEKDRVLEIKYVQDPHLLQRTPQAPFPQGDPAALPARDAYEVLPHIGQPMLRRRDDRRSWFSKTIRLLKHLNVCEMSAPQYASAVKGPRIQPSSLYRACLKTAARTLSCGGMVIDDETTR